MAPRSLQINLQSLGESFSKKTGYTVYYTVQPLQQKPQANIIILEVSITNHIIMIFGSLNCSHPMGNYGCMFCYLAITVIVTVISDNWMTINLRPCSYIPIKLGSLTLLKSICKINFSFRHNISNKLNWSVTCSGSPSCDSLVVRNAL